MDSEALTQAVRELQRSIEAMREDLRAKDAEITRLRDLLADRETRLKGMGDQALHLLELLHEARSREANKSS